MTWIGLRNIGKWIMDGDAALKNEQTTSQIVPPAKLEAIKEDVKKRFKVELDDAEADTVARNYRERQPNEHKPWRKEECRRLVILHREGRTLEDISHILGRTVLSVKMKLDKTDTVKWTRWSEEDIATTIQMRNNGKEAPEIAKAIKRTPNAVRIMIQHLCVLGKLKPNKSRFWAPYDKSVMETYITKGRITKAEVELVAKKLNRTEYSVKSYCRRELIRKAALADKEYIDQNYGEKLSQPSANVGVC